MCQLVQVVAVRGEHGRLGEVWGDLWGDMGRYGEIWGGMGRYGEIWGDMGRYGEMSGLRHHLLAWVRGERG